MSAHRDPAARGLQVGLGRDGVLPVGQGIGGEGQRLDHGDAHVCGQAFGPLRGEQRHPLQHQPPEPLVVLGEVVDGWARVHRRVAEAGLLAVELAGALDLERELHLAQLGVEAGRDLLRPGSGDQSEAIAGEVAALGGAYDEDVVGLGQTGHQGRRLGGRDHGAQIGPGDRPGDGDRSDPVPAVDHHVAAVEAGRHRVEQPDEHGALLERGHRLVGVSHLEVLDAVEQPGLLDRGDPPGVLAAEPHDAPAEPATPGAANSAT